MIAHNHRAPLRPAHRPDPRDKKFPLPDQLPDLGVKIADLALMISTPVLGALREHLDQTLDRLALPGTDLVRMNLVLRGDLLQRPLAPKRRQRHLRLQLSRKSMSLAAHLHSSVRRWNTP